jgi:hypothetical protein
MDTKKFDYNDFKLDENINFYPRSPQYHKRDKRAFSSPFVEPIFNINLKEKDKSSIKLLSTISIFSVTWNLYGKSATPCDIQLLLPKDKKYHIYAIGSEECMRSIFKSFFYSDKSDWEKMITYSVINIVNIWEKNMLFLNQRICLRFI